MLHWPRIRIDRDDEERDTFEKAKKIYERDVAEIREWLVGNLCRCTGYHNIVKAVQAAAKSMGGRRHVQ